eukprot:5136706-Lingulodinium_polyedra.AAC.1
MRRAAEALEGCVGMLGTRARECLDEQDRRNALQIPVPGGDGEDLAVGTGGITVSSGATQQ